MGQALSFRHQRCGTDTRGFTLIELLLVITVVGLILSFSVTAWLSMKRSQQISTTAVLLKTAAQCLKSYVIHSGTIPPQDYFIAHCRRRDPWGSDLSYENTADNREITQVTTKTYRNESGDHPDAAWIITSPGPDKTRQLVTSPSLWDCSIGDDLCQMTSRNTLFYEITK